MNKLLNFSSKCSNFSYCASKNASSVKFQGNFHLVSRRILGSPVLVNFRPLSVYKLNDQIQLLTEDKRKIDINRKTLRLQQDSNGRPLVLILSYLLAKRKHMAKYAEVYFKQGFDVLVTCNTTMQTFWPKRTMIVADDIVKFLKNNEYYDNIVLHGFSVGDFIWTQCILLMMNDPALKEKILRRIKGQVWDSMIHFDEIPVGLSTALFPDNDFLRKSLEKYIEMHLKVFYKPVTSHFEQAQKLIKENVVKTPALILVSDTDPIGTVKSNKIVHDIWKSRGIDVTWKCFESSPHVCHFVKYRDEYINLLVNHLKSLELQTTKSIHA